MPIYLTNDDGSKKVHFYWGFGNKTKEEDEEFAATLIDALNSYKWKDEDYLLVSSPRNGGHLTWEIMNMLLRDSPEYMKVSRLYSLIGYTPVTRIHEWLPSPKVLGTHYRTDVLPKEFRGKKTVFVMRNPKDSAVSLFEYNRKGMAEFTPDGSWYRDAPQATFSEFLRGTFLNENIEGGNYMDCIGYMWTLRDDPNMLILYYEDLVRDLKGSIKKIDTFMKTERSDELQDKIAEAMDINKMRDAKKGCRDNIGKDVGVFPAIKKNAEAQIFRKGKVGDWKSYFTVADNELMDSVIQNWSSKDIPFTYE